MDDISPPLIWAMRKHRRIARFALFLAGLGLLPGCRDVSASNRAESGRPETILPAVPSRWAGTASCSARACHGGIDPVAEPVLRNEYTTWVTRDRHQQAFLVLFDERSQRIARNLGIKNAHEE